MVTRCKYEVEVFYRIPEPAYVGSSLLSLITVWAETPAEARAEAIGIAGLSAGVQVTAAGVRPLGLFI